MQDVNTTESHDEPIPKKNKKNHPIKCMSEQAKSEPSEDGLTYDINNLNLGKSANDSESEPE